jgi:nitrogen-specific signal transduction histidine kinase
LEETVPTFSSGEVLRASSATAKATFQILPLLIAVSLCVGCKSTSEEAIALKLEDARFHLVETEKQDVVGKSITFVDLDGDGIEERILISEGQAPLGCSIVVTRYDGATMSRINLPRAENANLEFEFDINHDGLKELFVVTRESDTLYANLFSLRSSLPLRRFPLYGAGGNQRTLPKDVGVSIVGMVTTILKRDLLVCTFTAGLSLQPRGIAAYDVVTGERVWSFPIGALPNKPLIEEVDMDGATEIFLTADGLGNGTTVNNIDDSHSYLLGLAGDGVLLWRPRPLGGEFSVSRVFLSDFDAFGKKVLVCVFACAGKNGEKSYYAFFDPFTGRPVGTKREFEDQIVVPEQSPTLTSKGETNLIVCTRKGEVFIMDRNLDVISQGRFQVGVDDFKLVDLKGDNRKNIVVHLVTDKSIVLDDRLTPLAEIEGGFNLSTARLGPGLERSLILRYLDRIVVGRFEQNPSVYSRWLVWIGIFVAFIAGSAGALYGLYRASFYFQLYLLHARHSRHTAAMVLNRRGHILQVNHSLSQFFDVASDACKGRYWTYPFNADAHGVVVDFLKSALSRREESEAPLQVELDQSKVNLVVRVQPIAVVGFRVGWLVVFENVTDTMKVDRVLNWAVVAQNLAHEMKTPLMTIWFTIERLRQQNEVLVGDTGGQQLGSIEWDPLGSIEDEVRRLDRLIKGFMKLVDLKPPNLVESDLNAKVEELLSTYKIKFPNTMHLAMDLAEERPLVKLDVHLLTVAVINLVDNAIAAMEGKGTLRVSTYVEQNLNTTSVVLSIADTGPGIPEECLPKVFQSSFSKTEGGTGLGLLITKKIVEDHSGTITFKTQQGYGTEFIITLPVLTSTSYNHHG